MEVYYQGMLGLQKWYYLGLYIGALIVSNIPTYLKHRNDYNYRSLGLLVRFQRSFLRLSY